jgi:hypothetical protein
MNQDPEIIKKAALHGMKTEVISHFLSLTAENRKNLKRSYEDNIGIEEGTIIRYNKKTGKKNSSTMPWMIPSWKSGLHHLEFTMKELGEL